LSLSLLRTFPHKPDRVNIFSFQTRTFCRLLPFDVCPFGILLPSVLTPRPVLYCSPSSNRRALLSSQHVPQLLALLVTVRCSIGTYVSSPRSLSFFPQTIHYFPHRSFPSFLVSSARRTTNRLPLVACLPLDALNSCRTGPLVDSTII